MCNKDVRGKIDSCQDVAGWNVRCMHCGFETDVAACLEIKQMKMIVIALKIVVFWLTMETLMKNSINLSLRVPILILPLSLFLYHQLHSLNFSLVF